MALRNFDRAMHAGGLVDGRLAPRSVCVEPAGSHESEREEVLSAAEVARRLGVSRERVRQLAEEPGRFPTAVGKTGKSRAWRWGDVADWVAAGGRRPPGRPRAGK